MMFIATFPTNSIAFGSAPQREADSQPISQLVRPAASQTETHSLGFLSVADAAPSSGGNFWLQASSGQMVMQLTTPFLVGSSNPGQADMAAVPLSTGDRPGFEPPTQNIAVGCVTIRSALDVTAMGHPTDWSLLSENF